MMFDQFRFVVKRIKLAASTGTKNNEDAFGSGWVMWDA